MLLNTRHFGEIEVDESGIIAFSDGLPAFEDAKRFVLLGAGDGESPFRWLQAVDRPELAFALVDPFAIKADYDIEIPDEAAKAIEAESVGDIKVYSILVIPEDTAGTSMNLKAPIVINTSRRKGVQVVLDTDRYGVRHYISEELRKREVAGNACSDSEKGSVHCNK